MKFSLAKGGRKGSLNVLIRGPGVFLLGALALGLAACGPGAPPPSGPPPRAVLAAKAEVRDVSLYLDEIGNCTAYESVTVSPQVSGPITENHFTDGQEVKKGDLLFTIDPRPYQAA